ncbi:MAG: response regulator [Anaerolineae bacterium]|nr:response regulator [Anaerolineae bacterium]
MTDPTVVYFEDDALSREVMHACLTRGMGYHSVAIFEDSADFETKLARVPAVPDVVFLDIHMEPLDGFGMLRVIRADSAYAATRVVALTASVMNEEVRILKEAGFDGVIAKPLDYEIFPAILKRILAGEQVWHIR